MRNIANTTIDFLFGILEFLLSFRLLLKLFAANPATPFVNWIYSISAPFVYPFVGIFPDLVLGGRFVIESSTIFALVIYGIVAYVIKNLIYSLTIRYEQPHLHHI
jgi:YggT family protein